MVCQMDLLQTVKKNRHPYFEKKIIPVKEVAKAQAVYMRTWTV